MCSDGPVCAQIEKKTLSDGICRAAHGLHPSPLPLCSLAVRFKSHCGCISRWQQTAAIRWLWLPAYWGTWLLSSSSTVTCKHHLCFLFSVQCFRFLFHHRALSYFITVTLCMLCSLLSFQVYLLCITHQEKLFFFKKEKEVKGKEEKFQKYNVWAVAM